MSTETLATVLGRIPSGVFIMTARNADSSQETGMLTSWVQQAGFEPPTITVAVNRKRYLNDWLSAGSSVVLNLVGEQQKQFFGHFGKGFEPEEPAFEGLETERTAANGVVLKGAMAWLEGTVINSMDSEDHTVYLVEVQATGENDSFTTQKPYVHIRKNGLGY